MANETFSILLINTLGNPGINKNKGIKSLTETPLALALFVWQKAACHNLEEPIR
jgi:hypothetical protein